jgi:hypothetical protein
MPALGAGHSGQRREIAGNKHGVFAPAAFDHSQRIAHAWVNLTPRPNPTTIFLRTNQFDNRGEMVFLLRPVRN